MAHNIPYFSSFVKLGAFLNNFCENRKAATNPWENKLEVAIEKASTQNSWFTAENIKYALGYWGNQLSRENITQWLGAYTLSERNNPRRIAIIMAGNIPLVGFHDVLCVLFSGNTVLAKLSSNDKVLLPFLVEYLITMDPGIKERILFTEEQLQGFDAVIATGSNNTGRYFEYYFNKYPSIIRKNRNALAVISGRENKETLASLGEDIFRYYGLGCRSVSKLYVPEGYDFAAFFEAIQPWESILQNHKYANNYDYNKAVYLMSEFKILDNGFLILKEDQGIASPVGTVFFEYYTDPEEVKEWIKTSSNAIQCVVTHDLLPNEVPPGQTQLPALNDYADGVDTMAFLLQLD